MVVLVLSCQMVRSREVQSPFAQARLRHQYDADETDSSSCRTQDSCGSAAHGQDPLEKFARAFSGRLTAIMRSPSLCLS